MEMTVIGPHQMSPRENNKTLGYNELKTRDRTINHYNLDSKAMVVNMSRGFSMLIKCVKFLVESTDASLPWWKKA